MKRKLSQYIYPIIVKKKKESSVLSLLSVRCVVPSTVPFSELPYRGKECVTEHTEIHDHLGRLALQTLSSHEA